MKPIKPEELLRYLDDEAPSRLDRYFTSYAGRQFERFAGGGDRPEVADRFTSDDIVAVSMLSVTVPPEAVLQVLQDRPAEFNTLLSGIPRDADLWQVDEEVVARESLADDLWHLLDDLDHVAWVTAGKLLARKRPRLIPVYDDVVRKALGRKKGDEWWRPLRKVLVDQPDLIGELKRLREQAGLDDISLLRILDICIWTKAKNVEPTALRP